MTLSIVLCVMVLFIAIVDWVYLRGVSRHALVLEYVGFAAVLLIAAKSSWLSTLATILGVTRGVDVIIYPILIILFRESILGRVRYHRQKAEITAIVRSLAIAEKKVSDG